MNLGNRSDQKYWPLLVVAAMVYDQIAGSSIELKLDRLDDALARTVRAMADVGPIYLIERGTRARRQISASELAQGEIRLQSNGFMDKDGGRHEFANVTTQDMCDAIVHLKAAGTSLAEA